MGDRMSPAARNLRREAREIDATLVVFFSGFLGWLSYRSEHVSGTLHVEWARDAHARALREMSP